MTVGLEPTVPSPCVSVCKMTEDRSHCIGCLRTLAEIRAWKTMADEAKRALLVELEGRRAAVGV
ncbi:DUF1289 domain-containing protein [Azospirillum rugosum]|uniref:Fe-S protein YdhL (DUF1289 family) n=1 Tax=Azospirillum rugosum TaxID=416170 RepID=A0ABS4SPF8_9PROT|nr:DUF1289 domain-containing protein [Azospirillum rugosum]MBP2293993.1 putative Fe-S protein YdhL (DUF1289 family) [Azospirillum rugosum]MDQ0526820.1 putative Fe-S protein YdhL (DUF1289 family) [Azospirillum rugosum]